MHGQDRMCAVLSMSRHPGHRGPSTAGSSLHSSVHASSCARVCPNLVLEDVVLKDLLVSSAPCPSELPAGDPATPAAQQCRAVLRAFPSCGAKLWSVGHCHPSCGGWSFHALPLWSWCQASRRPSWIARGCGRWDASVLRAGRRMPCPELPP